jgi:hypothetical protein
MLELTISYDNKESGMPTSAVCLICGDKIHAEPMSAHPLPSFLGIEDRIFGTQQVTHSIY